MAFYTTIRHGKNAINISGKTPEQILITCKSGGGKTVISESLFYNLWRMGVVVIVIGDFKDEFESAFAQFEPKAPYHLNNLKKWGIKPTKVPVKLYHPYTFNIPHNKKFPDMQLYTIPIKSLTASELSIIAETSTETTALKIIENTLDRLKKDEGLHHLMYYAEEQIKPEQSYKGRQLRSEKAEEFFSMGSQGGDAKDVSKIRSYFQPYYKDYTWAPEDCPLNLDIKKLVNDTSCFHVFSSYFINSEKRKAIYIMNLWNQIIKHRNEFKHPICLYLSEIGNIVPASTEGYKKYLAEQMSPKYTTVRTLGIYTIGDAQKYFSIDSEVSKSMTQLIFGATEAVKDVENLQKALRLNTNAVNTILQLSTGEFVIRQGSSQEINMEQPIKTIMAPFRHKEVGEKFIQTYAEEKPEGMRNFNNEIEIMTNIREKISDDVRQTVKAYNNRVRREADEEMKRREEKEKYKLQEKVVEQQTRHDETTAIKQNIDQAIYNSFMRHIEQGEKEYGLLPVIAKEFNLKYYDKKEQKDKWNVMKVKRAIENIKKQITVTPTERETSTQEDNITS